MENIVIKPTSEIIEICDIFDSFIQKVLENRETFPSLGEFEAPIECLNLLYLLIRNTESVIVLGRKDLVLLPAAYHLTRSVLETGMRILWMLMPDDPYDREVRWLAHLEIEEELYTNLMRGEKDSTIKQKFCELKDGIQDFRFAVKNVLPTPYKPLSKLPNLFEMMKEIGEEDRYSIYRVLSQFTHGTHYASGTFRKGLGNGKIFGEFIDNKSWRLIFNVCSYCLVTSSKRIFEILNGDISKLDIENSINRINELSLKL